MTTQYTSILKLALPVQGELSGTWGDVVNDNITSMVEQAIAGRAVINSWTGNSHTLTTANGTTSESRCAMLEFTDTGAQLSGAGTVVCPALSKIYIAKNAAGQNVTLKTASGTGILVPNGRTMFLFCDGTNVVEAVTSTTSLQLGTSTTVTAVLDEDNMASNSATSLATQQSIKAYIDAQVGSFDTLAEVLAQGNTTGGTDIAVGTGDDITFADSSKAIFGAGSDLQIYHDTVNSVIKDAGTGNLELLGNNLRLKNADASNSYLNGDSGGAVTIYHAGVQKLATTSTGIDVTGDANTSGLLKVGTNDTEYANNYVRFKPTGAAYIDHSTVGQAINFRVSGSSSLDKTAMTLSSAGNVGIGTTNPANKFVVAEDTNQHGLELAPGTTSYIQAYDRATSDYGDLKIDAQTIAFGTDNGTERMRIDSSGNLLVGTTDSTLYNNTSGSGTMVNSFGRLDITRDDVMAIFNRNTSDGEMINFRKDGATIGSIGTVAGRLGIGTGDAGLFFDDDNNKISPVTMVSGTPVDSNGLLDLGYSGARFKDLYLSGTANVGSLSAQGGTGNAYLQVGSNTGSWAFKNYQSTHALTLEDSDGTGEVLRVDTSGNLLVGVSSTIIPGIGNTTAGISMSAVNGIIISRANDAPINISRNSSDGDLTYFRKDGAIVGSIGTNVGRLSIGSGDAGVLFAGDIDAIYPANGIAARDSAIDLGVAGARFKDLYLSGGVRNVNGDGFNAGTENSEPILIPADTSGALNGQGSLGHPSFRWKDAYLSGGVYLGGTGAANKLDDYETGTFTATLTAATSAPTTGVTTTAYYTKTGNVVNVFIRFSNKNTSGASGSMLINGLPFTSRNVTENQTAVPMMHKLTISEKYVTGYIAGNSTSINFINNNSNGVWTATQINATTAVYLNINMTYQTA
jgi:hypothetical protein